MTVSNQTPYVEYTANGSTTNFALTFNCDNANNLIVKVNDVESIGTWTLQGTSIVFITAPIAGSVVSIERNTPLERSTDYQTYDDSFSPKPVNKDFDSIWWKLQELYYKLINKVSIKRKINTVGGLTGGGDLSSDLNISIENQNVEPKTYGSSIKIPVITVNEKGIITGISVVDFVGSDGGVIQVGFEDILDLPTTLNGYKITDALNKNSNLSDLQDKSASRLNLNVYSKEEVDAMSVSIPDASTSTKGIIKLADIVDIDSFDNTNDAVTPWGLREGVKIVLNADGAAPVFACRAWGTFNATQMSGTYVQSGYAVTITMPAHGLDSGMTVNLSVVSGTLPTGSYTVGNVIDSNTFTFSTTASRNTSGSLNRTLAILNSGNVYSIVRDSTGLFTVSLFIEMLDRVYAINAVCSARSDATALAPVNGSITEASFQLRASYGGDNTAGNYDPEYCSFTVFR